MARLGVLVLLLLANAGYFAWSRGWLRDWGVAPAAQTEPQRLVQQIRPELLRIVSTGSGTVEQASADAAAAAIAAASSAAASAPAAAASCLQNPTPSSSGASGDCASVALPP